MNLIMVLTSQIPYVLMVQLISLEALVEIYRMMRPGEPPTKDAAEDFV